jgi:hypothetical protein
MYYKLSEEMILMVYYPVKAKEIIPELPHFSPMN